mmetsp:Transcript_2631/g.5311  ORF Transcript_2631/g.5311 Transcript_2631/m.5311 type:complete len:403 (+) Transcript_2631:1280-2488(+)
MSQSTLQDFDHGPARSKLVYDENVLSYIFNMGRVVRAKSPNIDVEHDRRYDYELVLRYLGQQNLLPDGPVQGDDEEGEDESNADSTNDGGEDLADHMSISDETVLEIISEQQHPREIVEDNGELLGTTHVYGLSSLPGIGEEDGEDDDELDGDEYSYRNYDSSSESSEDLPSVSVDENAAEFMNIFFSYSSSSEFEGLRKAEAADCIPAFSSEMLEACLGLIDGVPRNVMEADENEQRRVLLEWTQCTRSERVTMFMTQRQLKEHAEEFGLAQFMKWSGKVLEQRKRYAAMLESLLYSDEEEESPIESGENAHLIEYLKAWFMPPLKKGSDESRAATHGHRVEKRFLKQAFECIKESEGNFGASIDAIYAPGLVSSRHAMHLRDSADGVVMLTDTEGDLPSC